MLRHIQLTRELNIRRCWFGVHALFYAIREMFARGLARSPPCCLLFIRINERRVVCGWTWTLWVGGLNEFKCARVHNKNEKRTFLAWFLFFCSAAHSTHTRSMRININLWFFFRLVVSQSCNWTNNTNWFTWRVYYIPPVLDQLAVHRERRAIYVFIFRISLLILLHLVVECWRCRSERIAHIRINQNAAGKSKHISLARQIECVPLEYGRQCETARRIFIKIKIKIIICVVIGVCVCVSRFSVHTVKCELCLYAHVWNALVVAISLARDHAFNTILYFGSSDKWESSGRRLPLGTCHLVVVIKCECTHKTFNCQRPR